MAKGLIIPGICLSVLFSVSSFAEVRQITITGDIYSQPAAVVSPLVVTPADVMIGGSLSATSLFGNGAWITNISAANVSGAMNLGSSGITAGSMASAGNINAGGELISTLDSGLAHARYVSGNYGIIHRNDGAAYYILVTAPGDPYGMWNALRPLIINVGSGDVGIANGAIVAKHGGNVGIGKSNPSAKLDVNGSISASRVNGITSDIEGTAVYGYAGSIASNQTSVGGWFETECIDCWGVHGKANGPGGIGVRGFGATYGWDFYAAGLGSNYGPFTGGHEAILSPEFPADTKAGMIVAVTGQAKTRRAGDGSISISSTLPTVRLSNVPNDKKVFGVFVSNTRLPKDHWYARKGDERFGIINALGEGRVWVTNINGNISAGDYITTSSIPGYGQLQADALLHSYTLGKAIEDVDWESVTETVDFNGQQVKIYLIAVVYTSG